MPCTMRYDSIRVKVDTVQSDIIYPLPVPHRMRQARSAESVAPGLDPTKSDCDPAPFQASTPLSSIRQPLPLAVDKPPAVIRRQPLHKIDDLLRRIGRIERR